MIGDAVNRHLRLLHRLQQCRLRFRSSAVNFVGQHNLGHDWPGPELKIAGFLIIDGDPCYVAWQEIWGKLDAFECASNGARIALVRTVLPTPGTSSIKTCPW